MPTLKQRFTRTVGNWRWWVVLPLLPLALIGFACQRTGEEIETMFKAAHKWQQKGWRR